MWFVVYNGMSLLMMMMMMLIAYYDNVVTTTHAYLMGSSALSSGRHRRRTCRHDKTGQQLSQQQRPGAASDSELQPSPWSGTLPLQQQKSCQGADTSRRAFVVQQATSAAALATTVATSSMTLFTLFAPDCRAANLPQSTGADLSATGTVETLLPVLRLLESLATIQQRLIATQSTSSSSSSIQVFLLTEIETILDRNNNAAMIRIPTEEKSFKRLFDAYSTPVSYKQKFLDQNAFLVYYTQGYDGPNRPRLEEEQQQPSGGGDENYRNTAQQQTLQYGARNDAWTAWNDFVAELDFARKQTKPGSSSSSSLGNDSSNDDDVIVDLLEPLNRAIDAVSVYVSLAPESDVQEAYQRLRK